MDNQPDMIRVMVEGMDAHILAIPRDAEMVVLTLGELQRLTHLAEFDLSVQRLNRTIAAILPGAERQHPIIDRASTDACIHAWAWIGPVMQRCRKCGAERFNGADA